MYGSRALAASESERSVQARRALFATHCATCHGDSGRGDGASAAGFGTRPADLTDGRLMNGLPDEFLISVVTRSEERRVGKGCRSGGGARARTEDMYGR